MRGSCAQAREVQTMLKNLFIDWVFITVTLILFFILYCYRYHDIVFPRDPIKSLVFYGPCAFPSFSSTTAFHGKRLILIKGSSEVLIVSIYYDPKRPMQGRFLYLP